MQIHPTSSSITPTGYWFSALPTPAVACVWSNMILQHVLENGQGVQAEEERGRGPRRGVDFEGAESMSKGCGHDEEGCFWETRAWGMEPRATVRGSGRGVGRGGGAMSSRREVAAHGAILGNLTKQLTNNTMLPAAGSYGNATSTSKGHANVAASIQVVRGACAMDSGYI